MPSNNAQYIQALVNIATPSSKFNRHQLRQVFLDEINHLDTDLNKNLATRIVVQSTEHIHTNQTKVIGQLLSGKISSHDSVRIQPSGQEAEIDQLWIDDKPTKQIDAAQIFSFTLKNSPKITVGDFISSSKNSASIADQFETHIAWLGKFPMYAGRNYLIKVGSYISTISITKSNSPDLTPRIVE